MKKLISTFLTLLCGAAVTVSAADKVMEIGSVSPLPGSVITQFNYTTIVLQQPMEVASVRATEPFTYSVAPYGHASEMEAGFPLSVTRTRGGDIRIGFSDAVAEEIRQAGLWPVDKAGTYILYLPAGLLEVTDAAGEVYTNAELTLRWDLIPPVSCDITPDPAKKQGSLSGDVLVSFPMFQTVEITDDMNVSVSGPSGEIPMQGSCSVIENNLLIPVPGTLSEIGDYTFRIASRSLNLLGSESVGDQVSPEISFTYSVTGISKPEVTSVSPAQGAVESLSGVTLVYNLVPSSNPDCTENLRLFFDDKQILEYGNKSSYVQYAIDDEPVQTVHLVFAKDLASILRAPGKYRVEVPEGFLRFRVDDDYLYSDAMTLEYEIADRFDYTVSPMGGTVSEIGLITLTFEDAVDIKAMPLEPNEDGGGIIQIYTLSGSQEENLIPEVEISGDKVYLKFPAPAEGVRRVGNYSLDVPFGAFTITKSNGFTGLSQSITVNYNIPTFPLPVLDPAPGEVERLEEITFDLTDGLTYDLWFPSMRARLYKENADGTLGETAGYWGRQGTQSVKGLSSVTLYPMEEYDLKGGNYILKVTQRTFSVTVPEGSGYQGGFLLSDLMYRYRIAGDGTSVDTLPADADVPSAVYAIDGTMVISDANDDDLRRLPAGIYIFRGRKIAVR